MCRSHHDCRHEFVLMQNSEICCGPGFRTFMDNFRDDLNPICPMSHVPCPYSSRIFWATFFQKKYHKQECCFKVWIWNPASVTEMPFKTFWLTIFLHYYYDHDQRKNSTRFLYMSWKKFSGLKRDCPTFKNLWKHSG